MARSRSRRRDGESGQALVVMALFIAFVLAAMAAVVIDAGNSMAQQRATQNSVDAAALSGATVMVQNVGDPGSKGGSDVLSAIQSSFSVNSTVFGSATYVRYDLTPIGPVQGGTAIPSDAGGVTTQGSRTFATYLGALTGVDTMVAGATATALAGTLQGTCPNCALWPLTFPVKVTTCDGTNRSIQIGTDWVEVPIGTALEDTTGHWEAIVPLCTNGAGDVGWLDFKALGCPGNNLADWIGPPACDVNVPTPGWYQAKTGNTNAPEDNLNAYAGQIVSIPLFDGTCRYDPGDVPCPPEDTGSGSNFWYHIPRIEAFLLDRAYVQGNNHPECNQGPGYPPVGGNGETGCLKGWFLDLVSNGQVGDSSGTGGNPSYLGVQLVR